VLRGDASALPAEWTFYERAVAGDRDGALAALGGDTLAAYNRFVLTGDAAQYAALAPQLAGDVRLLLDAAAFAHGVIETPPAGAAGDPLADAYLAFEPFDEALDPRESPELWAGATLNLANALQHVRLTHVEENLWEAVALYEEILPVLPPRDQIRKARVLANQGNALAHLGAFSRAVPRLNEARAIFALSADEDSTAAIDATLSEIAERVPAAEAPHGHP
jgi:hypothetical protein